MNFAMTTLRGYKSKAAAQAAANRLRETYGMQMETGTVGYVQGDNFDEEVFPCGEAKAFYVHTKDRIDVDIFAYLED